MIIDDEIFALLSDILSIVTLKASKLLSARLILFITYNVEKLKMIINLLCIS